MKEVSLNEADRTIFSVCPKCNRTGKGRLAPNYYSMAYTKRQWATGPKCENCGTSMQFVHEVRTD
jgi:uncharacterized protein (DUF983 family)